MEKYLYNHKQLTTIESDRIIFGINDINNTHAIILKGGLWMESSFACFRLSAGNVCGLIDPLFEKYNFTYNAEDEVTFCPLNLEKKSYKNIFIKDPSYIRVFLSSYQYQLKQILWIYDQYSKISAQCFSKLLLGNNKLNRLNGEYKVDLNELGKIELFREEININQFNPEDENYLREFVALDSEELSALVLQSYEAASRLIVCTKHISDNIFEYTCNLKKIFDKLLDLYAGNNETNLFDNLYRFGLSILRQGGSIESVVNDMDSVIVSVQNFILISKEDFGIDLPIDIDVLNEKRQSLFKPIFELNEIQDFSINKPDVIEDTIPDFENLTEQILDFAGYSQNEKTEFVNSLNGYRVHQKNRFSKDMARNYIKKFEEDYLSLYERVYKASKEANDIPVFIIMFLDYGILSEKFFDEEDILKIYLIAKSNRYKGERNIYTFREWLDTIYNGQNEPSKNELDTDYFDYIRNYKKMHTLSSEEEKAMKEDVNAKISYEINNFLKSNLRLLFASNSNYCPFVNEFDYSSDFTSMITTAAEIIAAVDRWLSIDFTLFFRDQITSIKHHGENVRFIYKKEVMPNLIVLPIYGVKCSMWQEIADRNKNKPARIAIPMYKAGTVDDQLLYAFGRYRWEFTRTDMGTRWNDIRFKSLTSEYNDYIMFYRKNKNLSEITKNKIKDKLLSSRNNTTEMFLNDYVNYIKYESTGASRLNKESRRILGIYCPFTKELRKSLSLNPMFEDIMNQSEVKLHNEYKEINNRVVKLENEGTKVNKEIKDYLKRIGK